MSQTTWSRLGLAFLTGWLLCLAGELLTQRRRPALELVREYTWNHNGSDPVPAASEAPA